MVSVVAGPRDGFPRLATTSHAGKAGRCPAARALGAVICGYKHAAPSLLASAGVSGNAARCGVQAPGLPAMLHTCLRGRTSAAAQRYRQLDPQRALPSTLANFPNSKEAELCATTRQHDALVYVDEAYTRCNVRAGWRRADGPAGASDQVDVLMGTFAKGYGVASGHLVGADAVLDTIRSFAPAFTFTLAMPPALAAAAFTSVRHLHKSECERAQLRERTAQLKGLGSFRNTGIPMISEDSHIVSVQVGDPR